MVEELEFCESLVLLHQLVVGLFTTRSIVKDACDSYYEIIFGDRRSLCRKSTNLSRHVSREDVMKQTAS